MFHMPKINNQDRKEKQAKRHEEKKKYKTWSDSDGKLIKYKQEQEITTYINQFEHKSCSRDLIKDFQSLSLDTLHSR